MTRLYFLLASLLQIATALAQTPFHDVIKNQDKQRFTAQIQKDSVALTRLLSDKLVYSHSNGVVETKRQFIHSLITGRWNYQSIETDSVTVRLIDNSLAIVTGRARVTLLIEGKPTPILMAYTDIWQLQRSKRVNNVATGRWQLLSWAAGRLPTP
ncbi:nuclear transport factor 2 family protein [Fibrella sp. USSR17]